jgi:hypothetical protein
MNTKLLRRIPATVILSVIALLPATMMTTYAEDKQPATTASRAPSPDRKEWNAAEWRDKDWPDPGIILTNVAWDNFPLGEVARILRDQFRNNFDVLLPSEIKAPQPAASAIDPATGLPIPQSPAEAISPTDIPIRLQLKNVTASELFNAMNIMFETENAPWRWQLVMNGKRPTAVFRILPEVLTGAPSPVAREEPKKQREVIFVGDFIGDPKTGGMTDNQFLRTLSELYQQVYEPTQRDAINNLLRYHSATQILVVTGTPDENRFIADTLRALRQKLSLEQKRKFQAAVGGGGGSGGSESKSEATKTP